MIKVELIYTFATRKQKVEVIEVDDDGLLSEANFRALLSIPSDTVKISICVLSEAENTALPTWITACDGKLYC